MKTRRFLLAAGVSLALAFTFSCQPNDGYSIQCTDVSNGTFTDSRDGKTYGYVTICSQTWMAENLNYAVEGSKCYDNLDSNCVIYGRLYNWATAMGFNDICNSNACSMQIQSPHRGVCPEGWHVPANVEWDRLFRSADGASGRFSPYYSPTAGKYLKSATGWNSYSGIENLDIYGFAALPGGTGNSFGSFGYVGDFSYWWSTSEYNATIAYYRNMYYGYDYANWYHIDKSYLLSVRCVKDYE